MALFSWADLAASTRPELRWLHSVPNGGYRTAGTAGRMKGEGVKAGVPDVFLDVARGPFHGLRMELKVPRIQGVKGQYATVRAGTLSAEQDRWLIHYHENGYAARVAYGWTHAKQLIEIYLDDAHEDAPQAGHEAC